MKKRFLSLILVLCMAVTLLPTVALAATTYDIWVGSTQVTSDNASDVLSDGTVSFDTATKTLTLNNAFITSSAGSYSGWENCLIYFGQTATLRLVGDNTVDASAISGVMRLYGMINRAPLTISGGQIHQPA